MTSTPENAADPAAAEPYATLLAVGFDGVDHLLDHGQRWHDDPRRPQRLTLVAVSDGWPSRSGLSASARDSDPRTAALLQRLATIWPPPTPNAHLLDLDDDRFRVLLVGGDIPKVLRRLQLQADAIELAPRFAASLRSEQALRVAAALARLIRHSGTLSAPGGTDALGAALRAEGFVLQPRAGDTTLSAEFRPAFQPRRRPARHAALAAAPHAERTALIIGGGLAGALAAQGLAKTGWRCSVLDRHDEPAQETSGNPAGLFHGTSHRVDGLHARFTRTAALLAARRYGDLIAAGAISGAITGVLRLNPGDSPHVDNTGDYVRAVSADQARTLSGCATQGPAWLYPGGGWLAPQSVCRHALSEPGVQWHGGTDVSRLVSVDGGWVALDARGCECARAAIVVCATGCSPHPLLGDEVGASALPWTRIRGQVSWLDAQHVDAAHAGPVRPLSGHGYALRMDDGRLVFGASSHDHDDCAEPRASDNDVNLQRLAELCGLRPVPGAPLGSRVGWRATTIDRLPLVGAWPLRAMGAAAAPRQDHARLVPRVPGLYVLMGLASRGLTWGPLAAEVLAAWINGTPMPVETDLLDAIDPARLQVRQHRRQPSG